MFRGLFRKSPRPSGAPDSQPINSDETVSDSRNTTDFVQSRSTPTIPSSLEEEGSQERLTVSEVERSTEEDLVEEPGHKSELSPLDMEEDNENLLDWWRTVEGWEEWNETVNVQDNEDVAVQEAADRVYMAARLFVSLLDQRNESLKARVAELRTVADAADSFHKRTVAASVGGGVASVAGSVTTITGLILAPFTFGTSLIVTGVGIGVATAGGLTTASANITDTVHSKLDRKKVEKMIQGYQEDMQDIKECLEFVQEGMNVLQKWNFEEYTESLSRHALNQNVKHVIKEGGRAGKALVINTENLVSTVQVFSAAGGAARAAQAISVTTGVMSALFLALDIFFLAKNSHELRAGAKTKFAAKIREVCEELDEGLVELNQIKAELQKTMEGAELECDKDEEVEFLEYDAMEMAILEKELDQLENEVDQRAEKKQDRETFSKKNKEGKQGSEDVWETKNKKEREVRETNETEMQNEEMARVSVKSGATGMQEVADEKRKEAKEMCEKAGAGRPRTKAFLHVPDGAQEEESAYTEHQQPMDHFRKPVTLH